MEAYCAQPRNASSSATFKGRRLHFFSSWLCPDPFGPHASPSGDPHVFFDGATERLMWAFSSPVAKGCTATRRAPEGGILSMTMRSRLVRRALATGLAFALLAALPGGAGAASSAYGWQPTQTADLAASTVGLMQFAVAPGGDAMAVWTTPETGSPQRLVGNYRSSSGAWWGAVSPINLANETVMRWAIDLSPTCTSEQTVVFTSFFDYNYTTSRVWVAQRNYPSSSTWNRTEVGRTGFQEGPAYAFCRGENTTVVWTAHDGVRLNLWVNKSVGGVWSGASLLETSDFPVYAYTASADDAGDVIVAWSAANSTAYDLVATVFVPGSGWSTPAAVTPRGNGFLFAPPAVLVQPGGEAMAMWALPNATNGNDLLVSRFNPGAPWSTPEVATTVYGFSSFPLVRLAADGLGRVRAVWMGTGSGPTLGIGTARSENGTWGYPEAVASQANAIGRSLAAVVDAEGNAFVLWNRTSGAEYGAHIARYVEGIGWRAAEDVPPASEGASPLMDVQVGVDSTGTPTFAWVEPQSPIERVVVRKYLPYNLPPTVQFYTVYDGMTITRGVWQITGSTAPGAKLLINDLRLTVGDDGIFSFIYGFYPGRNLIDYRASDEFGNEYHGYLVIDFDDPLLAAQEALAGAEANVTELQASLNVTATELSRAEANLSAAQAAVAALESNATAAQDDLDAANLNLAAAQADVSALEAAQVRLATDLAAGRNNATALQARVDALTLELARAREDANATHAQLAAQNASAQGASQGALEARAAASSAQTMGILGVVIGLVGLVVAGMAMLGQRRKGAGAPRSGAGEAPRSEPHGDSSKGGPPTG